MIDRAVGVQLSAIQTESNLATSALRKQVEQLRNEIAFGETIDQQRETEWGDAPYSPPIPQSNHQTVPPASLRESAARPPQSTAHTASELLSKALRREAGQSTADILKAVDSRQHAPEIPNPDAGQLDNPPMTVARLREVAAIERQQQFERQQQQAYEHEIYRKAEQAAQRLANLERAYANRRPYPVSDDYSMEEIRRVAKSAERDFAMQDAIEKARAEAAEAQEIADVHAQISELRRELAQLRGYQ